MLYNDIIQVLVAFSALLSPFRLYGLFFWTSVLQASRKSNKQIKMSARFHREYIQTAHLDIKVSIKPTSNFFFSTKSYSRIYLNYYTCEQLTKNVKQHGLFYHDFRNQQNSIIMLLMSFWKDQKLLLKNYSSFQIANQQKHIPAIWERHPCLYQQQPLQILNKYMVLPQILLFSGLTWFIHHQFMQAPSLSKIGHRQQRKDRASAQIKLFSFLHQSKKAQLDDSLRNQSEKPTEKDQILERQRQNQQKSHFFQDFQEGWLKNCDDWETETQIREF